MEFNNYGKYVEDHWFSDEGPLPDGMTVAQLKELFVMTAGLGGETGEILEKIKKWVRDGNLDRQLLLKELGDAQFYLVKIAGFFGFEAEEIPKANIEKLDGRRVRGTQRGSGDTR